MEISIRDKVLASIVVIAASFAFGRYSAPSDSIKTVETNQTDTQTQKDTETKKTTTITEDTTGKKTTVINEDTTTTTKKDKQSNTTVDQSVTPTNKDILNVSALIASDGFSLSNITPVYGLSVTKNFIGPVTMGAFGLTNKTIGVSFGLNF